jgi:hypothetical protein
MVFSHKTSLSQTLIRPNSSSFQECELARLRVDGRSKVPMWQEYYGLHPEDGKNWNKAVQNDYSKIEGLFDKKRFMCKEPPVNID